MPTGPKGEKRPADVTANAVRVVQIATGEAEETFEADDGKDKAAQAMGRKGGSARARKLTESQRSAIARQAAESRWRRSEVHSSKMLVWEKQLTASDAQQDTNGSKMPFLRFTKASRPENHKVFYRNSFFANLPWSPIPDGEETVLDLDVTILGQNRGSRRMRLDHKPGRASNNSAPTTHLHYDTATRHELESLPDPIGATVRVTRSTTGAYSLEVL